MAVIKNGQAEGKQEGKHKGAKAKNKGFHTYHIDKLNEMAFFIIIKSTCRAPTDYDPNL
jgi:hypothetical protein